MLGITVFDADNEVNYHKMFIVADRLASEGIPSYMESSRRGGALVAIYAKPY